MAIYSMSFGDTIKCGEPEPQIYLQNLKSFLPEIPFCSIAEMLEDTRRARDKDSRIRTIKNRFTI